MAPIKDSIKKQAAKMFSDGKSEREVAKQLGISNGSAHNLSIGVPRSIPKSTGGRKSLLTKRDKAWCARTVTKDGKTNATEVMKALQDQLGIAVSTSTVRRALKSQGLESFVKPKKPHLSAKNVKARLEFAKAHINWTLDDWKRVIWSDETKVNRFGSDGRHYGWKRSDEQLKPKHVKQVIKHGGGKPIMIWGCITYQGPGYMTKIDGTMDQHLYKQILQEELVSTMQWYGYRQDQVIFQHDNDPKHTAKSVQEYLEEQPYTVMKWPAQSPDLNPIENIWSMLKIKLFRNYAAPPAGVIELWQRVEETWNGFTEEECQNVINTMPKRCSDVIKAKGYWIDY